jgi:hypothetical protein
MRFQACDSSKHQRGLKLQYNFDSCDSGFRLFINGYVMWNKERVKNNSGS